MSPERTEFLKAHARAGRHCTGPMLLEALAAVEEAEKVNARLTEYAKHVRGCPGRNDSYGNEKCNCGLAALLDTDKTEKKP